MKLGSSYEGTRTEGKAAQRGRIEAGAQSGNIPREEVRCLTFDAKTLLNIETTRFNLVHREPRNQWRGEWRGKLADNVAVSAQAPCLLAQGLDSGEDIVHGVRGRQEGGAE
jgi:hypothetical protein